MRVLLLFYSLRLPTASCLFFFFSTDPATTEIYTLSLHDALPISLGGYLRVRGGEHRRGAGKAAGSGDRKSTRLNSSHRCISYAVFCLKKKKKKRKEPTTTYRRTERCRSTTSD